MACRPTWSRRTRDRSRPDSRARRGRCGGTNSAYTLKNYTYIFDGPGLFPTAARETCSCGVVCVFCVAAADIRMTVDSDGRC